MANIRKSFNFRNGVQVDNDNFVVNANGLVGIGTSIPTEAIDVIGNAKISGLTTTTNLGVAETANFHGDLKVGTGITMSGGIVTAVSFYGDGSTLSNVFAIATAGWVPQGVGLHTLSRSVGIGTTNPVYKLQIGLDPVTGVGVGITNGNIIVSGIITATTFVGNVTGTATTANNLSDGANITTGTISNDRLPNNINKPTGIITASSFIGNVTGTATTATNLADGANITTGTISNDRLPSNINKPSGIITASSFVGDVTGTATTANNLSDGANITTGTISDARLPDLITSNINASSGISTFVDIKVGSAVTVDSSGINTPSGIITASSFVGDVTGTATTANNLSDGANITTGTISDDRLPDLITSNINISSGISTFNDVRVGSAVTIGSTGIVTATTFVGNVTGTATTATALSGTPDITVGQVTSSNLSASGIVTATTELNVGSDGAGLTALSTGNLGIGTTNPTSELLIRKSSGSLLEVISDSGQSRISIGNSVGVGNSSGVLRFANSAGVLDLVNNDVGDIKSIIHGGTGAGSTGNFKWIYGQTNAERMTLTYDGNLGINDTTPSQRLSVGGGVTVTGSVHIDNDLTIDGTLNANISYPSLISGTNLSNISGITTLNNLKVSNSIDFSTMAVVALGNTVAVGTDLAASDPSDGIPFDLTVNNKLKANRITVQEGIDMSAGIMTASNVRSTFGFRSGIGTEFIKIDYASSPDRIIFSILGIGSTSLQLF